MAKTNTALSFSDEQAMLLESARGFCADKSPIPRVRELMQDPDGFDPAVWEEMIQLGWMGPWWLLNATPSLQDRGKKGSWITTW